MDKRVRQMRAKILSVFPRNMLEELSGLERPWNADRPTLIEHAIAAWPADEIEDGFASLMRRAA